MEIPQEQSNIPVTFSLIQCQILDFKFSDYAKKNKDIIAYNKFEFEFQLTMDIKELEKNISFTLKIKLFEKKTDIAKYEICELISLNLFNIVNFEEAIKKNDGQFQIPNTFIAFANTVSVNNTRGMLVAKLENSAYNNAVIPLIDMGIFNQIPPQSAPTK